MNDTQSIVSETSTIKDSSQQQQQQQQQHQHQQQQQQQHQQQQQQQHKKNWSGKLIQKLSQMIQTDENKKMIHVFLVDPILNHVLERIFPYVLILCVLFVILTIMITVTLLLVFTRLPAAFREIHNIVEI